MESPTRQLPDPSVAALQNSKKKKTEPKGKKSTPKDTSETVDSRGILNADKNPMLEKNLKGQGLYGMRNQARRKQKKTK
jgi:hypothetical protein